MGQRLAKAAKTLQADAEPCGDGAVRVSRRILRLPWREISPQQVDCATAHVESVSRGDRPPPLAPRLYNYAWHFYHQGPAADDWLAREILGLWEVKRRSEVREIKENIEIQLIAVGGLRILALPGEPFGAIGRVLREQHPHLLIAEQSNGHAGYLPASPAAFERGGYECCTAQQSRLVPEAGPAFIRAGSDLLGSLQDDTVPTSLREAR